jgi:protease I
MSRLTGKSVVIITAHEFEDIEVMYTLLRLSEEGAEVDVATLPKDAVGGGHFSTRPYDEAKTITGRFGATVPFVVLQEGLRWRHVETPGLDADDYDAVVVPGGFAPDYLRLDDSTLRFIAGMHVAGKVVAAICHGPQVLISVDANLATDVIRGRDVTCYAAVRDDIRNAGGSFHEAPAVVAGNVVTGRCPDDLPDFCQAVIHAIRGTATDGVYDLRGAAPVS